MPRKSRQSAKLDMVEACVEIGKLMTSTLDVDEVLRRIMVTASELVPAQNWSLLLRDEITGELTFDVVVGIDPDKVKDLRLPEGDGVAGIVAQTRQPVFIEDAQNDPRVNREVDRRTGYTTQSIACLPLAVHDVTSGVIEVVNLANMEGFMKNEFPMLRILADYAAIALENARQVEKIRHLTLTDEYTGLYNARHLHIFLDQLIARNVSPIAVCFADIDNFKEVVDTHGHLKGSRVLREVGETILGAMGPRDVLVKYGGDEFVLVMPGRDRESAVELLENVRMAVRETPFLDGDNGALHVTASFGLALYPDDAPDKKNLLLAADHAMYRIKRTTKDSVGGVDD